LKKLRTEKNKIPGVCYAFTWDGIELPVLDITHPLFISSIDEGKLEGMITRIAPEARKRAESFNRMPLLIKRFLSKNSFIMAGMLGTKTDNEYVSGLSTMMMKLGPGLIGKGKVLDRLGAKTSGAIMVRMRARDTASFLADSIRTALKNSGRKELCLVNIGGGTATDSLNALILLAKSDPGLIPGIKIELNILDVDDYGPLFAIRSVEALMSGGPLKGMDITCRHVLFDWRETSVLSALLTKRADWLTLFSSEGGLFEYAEEDDIINVLRTIAENVNSPAYISGSLIKDPLNVDPVYSETVEIMPFKPKQYGIDGLKRIAEISGWKINATSDKNPRYLIFSLVHG